ncbi:MAG: alcohol dehydrogenase catalytic domain-containing protein [Phycisphaerae bacterium]|nr:alcohol dehydrogenase catalytic domain-containing protein [Phycisphaerae bacterium]
MKAAIFTGPGRITLDEKPVPDPGPGQALVRLSGCGVCGTDVHIFHGDLTEGITPPVVLGHEIAGLVERVGPGVDNVRVGDNVAVDPLIACGRCEDCHAGRPNLCRRPTTVGYAVDGGFAQYACVPATHLYKLKPSVPPKGGILVETLACVLHGYDRLGFQAGCSAMILGAGTVGLLWNQLLGRSPRTLLIQSEPVAFRRKLAGELGADVVIDPGGEDVAARVGELAPDGIDYIVDASGNPDALAQAIPLVKRHGTFMIFGVCPKQAKISINPHDIYQAEAKIIASKMPPLTLGRSVELIEAGLIDYERIVTTTLSLESLPEAVGLFEQARDRHVKMMIDPWE